MRSAALDLKDPDHHHDARGAGERGRHPLAAEERSAGKSLQEYHAGESEEERPTSNIQRPTEERRILFSEFNVGRWALDVERYRLHYETNVAWLPRRRRACSRQPSQPGDTTPSPTMTPSPSSSPAERSRRHQDQRRRNGRRVLAGRGAEHGREFQEAGEAGLLRWHRVPSHHQGLHDPGRRSDDQGSVEGGALGHGRSGLQDQGGVQREAARARRALDGALGRSGFRRQPVLHLLTATRAISTASTPPSAK